MIAKAVTRTPVDSIPHVGVTLRGSDLQTGLTRPGDSARFRVYAVNRFDRERGRNVVEIAWPPG